MKTKFSTLLIFVFALMTACSSDDDDPVVNPNYGTEVAGTYKGYTVATFAYTTIPMTNVDQSVVLTATADNNTVNLTYTSDTWGVFTISGATVTLKDDVYTIVGTGKTVMGMEAATPKEYECTVSGTISKDKKASSFVFDVPAVMKGLKITFASGEAPTSKVVAGTYTGYTVADFKYTTIPMTTPSQTVTMTSNEDNTSKLTYVSDTWGTFTVSNATVTFKDDIYTITGSGKTVMGMEATSQKEYDCTVAGTISKDKKTVSFVFDVPAVMGGLKITFTQGDAPANMVIAGVYNGSLDMGVNGASMGKIADSKVTIKSQENGKVEVTLTKFSLETGMGFKEDVVLSDVDVTLKDGVYTISKEKIETTSGTTAVTGSMTGTIEAGDADIVFNLKPGAMPFALVCTFTSSK